MMGQPDNFGRECRQAHPQGRVSSGSGGWHEYLHTDASQSQRTADSRGGNSWTFSVKSDMFPSKPTTLPPGRDDLTDYTPEGTSELQLVLERRPQLRVTNRYVPVIYDQLPISATTIMSSECSHVVRSASC